MRSNRMLAACALVVSTLGGTTAAQMAGIMGCADNEAAIRTAGGE